MNFTLGIWQKKEDWNEVEGGRLLHEALKRRKDREMSRKVNRKRKIEEKEVEGGKKRKRAVVMQGRKRLRKAPKQESQYTKRLRQWQEKAAEVRAMSARTASGFLKK